MTPERLILELLGLGLNWEVVETRAVAAELKVPLLDLNTRSIEQMNQLGPEGAAMFDPKPKDPTKPDKTHLSAKVRRKPRSWSPKKFGSKCPSWQSCSIRELGFPRRMRKPAIPLLLSALALLSLRLHAAAEQTSWKLDFSSGTMLPGFTQVSPQLPYDAKRGFGLATALARPPAKN